MLHVLVAFSAGQRVPEEESEAAMQLIVLRRNGLLPVDTEFVLPSEFSSSWWRVTFASLKPPGRRMFLRYWLSWFLFLIGGESKAYRALLIRNDNGRIVHSTMLFPKDFKAAFMGEKDLEIGRTFTDPDYRGLGLAKYGLQQVLRSGLVANGYYWYVVDSTNVSSMRVARANGFEVYGFGCKQPLLGLDKLGRIMVHKRFRPDSVEENFTPMGF